MVTFDDITELLAAQRKAAWSEIARRIGLITLLVSLPLLWIAWVLLAGSEPATVPVEPPLEIRRVD